MTWQITENNLDDPTLYGWGQLYIHHPDKGSIILWPTIAIGCRPYQFSIRLSKFTSMLAADEYLQALEPEIKALLGKPVEMVDNSDSDPNIIEVSTTLNVLNERQADTLAAYLLSNAIGLPKEHVDLIFTAAQFRSLSTLERAFERELVHVTAENFESLFDKAQALMQDPDTNRYRPRYLDYLNQLAIRCFRVGLQAQALKTIKALANYPDNVYSDNAAYRYLKLKDGMALDGLSDADEHERLRRLINETVQLCSTKIFDCALSKLLGERIAQYADYEAVNAISLEMGKPETFFELLLRIGDDNYNNKRVILELRAKLQAYEAQASRPEHKAFMATFIPEDNGLKTGVHLSARLGETSEVEPVSCDQLSPKGLTSKFDSMRLGRDSTSLSYEAEKQNHQSPKTSSKI